MTYVSCTNCDRIYSVADQQNCPECGSLGSTTVHVMPLEEFAKPPEKASSQQVGGGHYKDMAIQPSEYIHKNNLGWCEGNIVKYASRHKHKNGAEDLRKVIHYTQLLLEWEYGE